MSLVDFLSSPPRKVGAVVLAGGKGSRMGGLSKGDIAIGGETILSRIKATLSPQAAFMAISVRSGAAPKSDLPTLPDDETVEGPLAGLLSALSWGQSQGLGWVLTVPSDTPYLPADLTLRLASGLGRGQAAIAASNGRRHPVIGLWSVGCLDRLLAWLRDGQSNRIGDFAKSLAATEAEWPDHPRDPFFNVNTPAERILADELAKAEFRPAGTIVLPDDISSDALQEAFAIWAKASGLTVGGVLQSSRMTGPDGTREIFLTDIGTGQSIPIMQKLGRTSSCAVDTRAIAAATAALRSAVTHRPDIVIVNKFGYLEEEGGGMIDEMLSIMAQDLPLLISTTEKRLPNWLARCGGYTELLAPELPALQAWWARIERTRPIKA